MAIDFFEIPVEVIPLRAQKRPQPIKREPALKPQTALERQIAETDKMHKLYMRTLKAKEALENENAHLKSQLETYYKIVQMING